MNDPSHLVEVFIHVVSSLADCRLGVIDRIRQDGAASLDSASQGSCVS